MPPHAEDCAGFMKGLFLRSTDGEYIPFPIPEVDHIAADNSKYDIEFFHNWQETELDFRMTVASTKKLVKQVKKAINRMHRDRRNRIRKKEKARRARLKGEI